MKKGREFNPATLFIWISSLYFYYINFKLLPRQVWRLYFPSLFIDLPGKSSKWGLDKIYGQIFSSRITRDDEATALLPRQHQRRIVPAGK
jgi:hypothetical protein